MRVNSLYLWNHLDRPTIPVISLFLPCSTFYWRISRKTTTLEGFITNYCICNISSDDFVYSYNFPIGRTTYGLVLHCIGADIYMSRFHGTCSRLQTRCLLPCYPNKLSLHIASYLRKCLHILYVRSTLSTNIKLQWDVEHLETWEKNDDRKTLTANSLKDTPYQDPQLHINTNQYHANLQMIKSELKFQFCLLVIKFCKNDLNKHGMSSLVCSIKILRVIFDHDYPIWGEGVIKLIIVTNVWKWHLNWNDLN